MKTIKMITFLMLAIFFQCNSQDTIYMQNGNILIVKVIELNSDSIRYKYSDNLEGPVVIESKDNINRIIYKNGAIQDFDVNSQIVQGSTIQIEGGTKIMIELQETLSSNNLSIGQPVHFIVKEDLKVGKFTLIKTGTPLAGAVTHCKKADILGEQGELEIKVFNVNTINNQSVSLSGNIYQEGENKTEEVVIIGALVFWPLLFLKGKEAEIPAGSIFYVEVAENSLIEF